MRRIALIAATTCLVTLVAGALARAQVPIVTDTIPAEDRAAAAVVPDWEVPRTEVVPNFRTAL